MIAAMEFHPLADLFPLLAADEQRALTTDIMDHGLFAPIMTFEGKILDGRNRYLACQEAGVEPVFKEYKGDDPLGYVVSLNMVRRHLNESQRAMIAARVANMRQGARTDLSPIGEKSQAQAASMFNVGKRSVERAGEVLDKGSPELIEKVEHGDLAVSAAASIVREGRPATAFKPIFKPYVRPADKYLAAQEARLGPIDAGESKGAEAISRPMWPNPPPANVTHGEIQMPVHGQIGPSRPMWGPVPVTLSEEHGLTTELNLAINGGNLDDFVDFLSDARRRIPDEGLFAGWLARHGIELAEDVSLEERALLTVIRARRKIKMRHAG
jgi:hypothetical protein